ncbi:hypothetical protein [Mobiluncus porci]|uniref:Uncharacterized protein n=1 Tax=Mobiluncus porci TaxID=2652278 RepID=A0A7K0K2N2_9ACTO|nr:hypothetical protein [Mobiluncus porci]MST49320.1 hypothetical protein [Mobiluncus porci]
MVFTIDLPPDVAAKVSQLAKESGTDDATLVASFAEEAVNKPQETSKIIFDSVSGWPVLTGGKRMTQEEIFDFLHEED